MDLMMRSRTDRQEEHIVEVSDYGKRRLLTYADSFRELARSFEGGYDFDNLSGNRQELLTIRRIWENRQVLCENLNEMAQIMTRVASEVFHCHPFDEKKKKVILHALKAEGIIVTEIFYIERPGERGGIGITMYTDRAGGYTAAEVADMLSVLMDQRLEISAVSPYVVGKDKQIYVFVEEARFVVLTGSARAVKENENLSGDNFSVIESERGKLTVLVSDGMGSGEKACADSEKVLDLMERLLEAGYGMDAAINLVNSALIAGEEEHNMSTLDVCDLDLYDGVMELCKIGASTAYIKRKDFVEQISSHSLPLGIFTSAAPEITRRELMDGDYVILMTDGVQDALAGNNCEEAMRLVISGLSDQNPKEIADKLLQFVLRCSGGHVQDDMTIIVVGIWENAAISQTCEKNWTL